MSLSASLKGRNRSLRLSRGKEKFHLRVARLLRVQAWAEDKEAKQERRYQSRISKAIVHWNVRRSQPKKLENRHCGRPFPSKTQADYFCRYTFVRRKGFWP